MLCCAVLCCVVLCCVVLCCVVLCSVVLCCVVLCSGFWIVDCGILCPMFESGMQRESEWTSFLDFFILKKDVVLYLV